jgi:hypothetical protein
VTCRPEDQPGSCFNTREQMIIVAADGLVVEDIRGRKYLDATAGGVWSVLAGYGRVSDANGHAPGNRQMVQGMTNRKGFQVPA